MTVAERTVGGLFLREQGSGPAVVLLHGFPQTGACWDPIAARLAARFRVIVPDLPGYGASRPARSAAAGDVAA
ncbi:MAG: alpha/beta fold hydrolase, partial [Actinomycetota bacterium]